MSSRFNPSNRPRMQNPVCIKTTVEDATTDVAGYPFALIVAAWWHDLFISPPAIISQVLTLMWNQPTKTWSNQIPTGLYNLRAIITKLAAADHYDVLLELYFAGTFLDDDSWHDVHIAKTHPFRWRKLEHVHTPASDFNGLHVLS